MAVLHALLTSFILTRPTFTAVARCCEAKDPRNETHADGERRDNQMRECGETRREGARRRVPVRSIAFHTADAKPPPTCTCIGQGGRSRSTGGTNPSKSVSLACRPGKPPVCQKRMRLPRNASGFARACSQKW